jgi:DNA polymerase-1
MTRRKQLALIDGHALAYRAFHALADANLRASSGEPTYAVFGFAQILLTALQEYQPDYVAVAFDVGRTFRDDLYAEYKAGRAETPAEFHPQLERIRQLVTTLNIPIYTAEGYEADDVIGTLSRQATAQDIDTLILTGDTDTLQLVDEHVRVVLANPYGQKTTTTLYDLSHVEERYKGLKPYQLADLRGLKGDKSDNIPGVAGIGDTGALSLLAEFGTIENLYEHLEETPKRYRKKLEGQRDQALFSKKLSIIVCDAPVTLDPAAATLHDYDRAAVIALFQDLEFGSSLVKKLPQDGAHLDQAMPEATAEPVPLPDLSAADPAGSSLQMSMFGTDELPPVAPPQRAPVGSGMAPALGDYQAVITTDDLDRVIEKLNRAPGFAFDTEGTGLHPFQCDLVGISLAVEPGSAWYIPFGHRSGEQLPRQQVLNALRPFFADPQKPKYAHNAKFDMAMLLHAGMVTQGLTFDTLIAARLLGKQRVSLKELAFYELKVAEQMQSIEELIGRGAKQTTFDYVPIAQAVPYAAADADMTLRLKHALEPQLQAQERISDIFTRFELPLVPVLVAMEQAGIKLDVGYMQELSAALGQRQAELEQEIYAYAERPFNINSSDQLSGVLFDKLGLPADQVKRTAKTKKYSLTADTLEQMRDKHQIIDLILQYRQLAKLKSTYVDALPGLVNPETGRVHTSFNQMGTATGRLSSNDPNLQNIPVRTEEGREIRRAFVAAPGHVFIAADYSQIELRVLAHITLDPNLVQAFEEGQDIHAATAAQLFNVPIRAVDKHQRRLAKTTVFGIVYGISSFGLAQRTGLSRTDAQSLIDALFARFPQLRSYIDTTLEQGRHQGYVESLFGRRRAMPELTSSNGQRRQAAEREAINAPIQATAADIMKLAMIRVADELKRRQLRTRLLLQVHDELIFEAPDAEADEVQHLVREMMEQICPLRVPLKVDLEVGRNWEEMTEVA